MDAKVCYEENLDTIRAVPTGSIVKLNIPKEEVSTEANQLEIVTEEDKPLLIERGLKEETISQLPIRAAAFAYAAVQYEINSHGASEYQEKWDQIKEDGYKLVKKLNSEFGFAFRHDESALKDLSEVKEGKGDKEMAFDLLGFEALGRKYMQKLEDISFNVSLLDKAKEMHTEVSCAYAEMKVHCNEYNSARVIRDQAFTWLKEVMDEIREYGRFVFEDEPEKEKRYISEYYHNLGLRTKNSSKNENSENDISTIE